MMTAVTDQGPQELYAVDEAWVKAGAAPESVHKKVAFVFGGEGTELADMGRDLYDLHPSFREAVRRSSDAFAPYLPRPLTAVLYGETPRGRAPSDMTSAHAAVFTVEYALAELCRSWAVYPDALLGDGLGEYVAACVADVFSVEDAARLLAIRGRLMEATAQLLGSEVGARGAAPAWWAGGEGGSNGGGGPHAPLLGPHLPVFEKAAGEVAYALPRIPVVSSATGDVVGRDIATACYWVRHAMSPSRFDEAVALLERQNCGLLDISPRACRSRRG